MSAVSDAVQAKAKIILNKLPFEGAAVSKHIWPFIGKHGGKISDSQLKYFTRKLNEEERHWLAVNWWALEKRVVRNRIIWVADDQTDQSIAKRNERLAIGCCPVHGVAFTQVGSWADYDANFILIDPFEEFCAHCPHCQAKGERIVHHCTEARCIVCPITCYMGSDWKVVKLLPEFEYLLGRFGESDRAFDEANS